MTLADQLQLWLAVATLPVAAYFIYMFGKPSERFWRSWFGISLMLIAVAILMSEVTVILFRVFGPEYTARDFLRVFAQILAFVAMSLRTWVLHTAQRHDKRKHPHRLR